VTGEVADLRHPENVLALPQEVDQRMGFGQSSVPGILTGCCVLAWSAAIRSDRIRDYGSCAGESCASGES
jgi:hypothetical protein